jgi:hypothetical protein
MPSLPHRCHLLNLTHHGTQSCGSGWSRWVAGRLQSFRLHCHWAAGSPLECLQDVQTAMYQGQLKWCTHKHSRCKWIQTAATLRLQPHGSVCQLASIPCGVHPRGHTCACRTIADKGASKGDCCMRNLCSWHLLQQLPCSSGAHQYSAWCVAMPLVNKHSVGCWQPAMSMLIVPGCGIPVRVEGRHQIGPASIPVNTGW